MSNLIPIRSIASAKDYEAEILQDDPGKTASAMHNAGQAIGEALYADYQEIGPWPAEPVVLVLCGKGLNTGDALVACERLHEKIPGLQVRLVLTAEKADWGPLPAKVLDRLKHALREGLQEFSLPSFLERGGGPYDVVLDGLYGHGFRPPLREGPEKLLKAINARRDVGLRAAIDLPSGMGEETDANAFKADFTYIPGVAKAPCFKADNRTFTGRLRFLEIEPFLGQEADKGEGTVLGSPRAFKALNRLRRGEADKRHFGHCLIMAGSHDMPGAALMSTLGALQAGAGLLTVFSPEAVINRIAGHAPEAMWRTLPLRPDGSLDMEAVRMVMQAVEKADALLIGPGLQMDRGTSFALCRIVRECQLPLVVDASALTSEIAAAVRGRSLSAPPVIMTPHPGELKRMQGQRGDSDLEKALLAFAAQHRCITVLKGNPTLVSDGQRLVVAPVGGPVLARGGSGDILAGMTTTLLAQQADDPVLTALRAVTWHGAAADALARENGAIAVRTTDLIAHLPRALRA